MKVFLEERDFPYFSFQEVSRLFDQYPNLFDDYFGISFLERLLTYAKRDSLNKAEEEKLLKNI